MDQTHLTTYVVWTVIAAILLTLLGISSFMLVNQLFTIVPP